MDNKLKGHDEQIKLLEFKILQLEETIRYIKSQQLNLTNEKPLTNEKL